MSTPNWLYGPHAQSVGPASMAIGHGDIAYWLAGQGLGCAQQATGTRGWLGDGDAP